MIEKTNIERFAKTPRTKNSDNRLENALYELEDKINEIIDYINKKEMIKNT